MNIEYVPVVFGADPEFFFTKEGKVIGAEKVLPKNGVVQNYQYSNSKAIIIDGVQAEFNPLPNSCRQEFSKNLRNCFVRLDHTIAGKTVEVDFGAGVEIDETELSSLDKQNQQFGCSPSKNAYRDSTIQVKDASKYHYRSAGGHIHLGTYDCFDSSEILLKDPELVVHVLDIILGNTCVLIDRDPGNIERRKNYGRAGEYRTPEHGLEYRTLSNFWLRSYPLMSLVLGLARLSVAIAYNKQASKKLLALVDREDIERAINNNDAALAQKNFECIKDFLALLTVGDEAHPLSEGRMESFELLAKDGVTKYFPQDPMTHWLAHEIDNGGWEMFADYNIHNHATS